MQQYLQKVAPDSSDTDLLAQEAIEAVRRVRDRSWSEMPATPATVYPAIGLSGANAGDWVLNTGVESNLDGLFTRQILFEEVKRNGTTKLIDPAGAPDPDSRKITVRLQWGSPQKEVLLDTYITNVNKPL